MADHGDVFWGYLNNPKDEYGHDYISSPSGMVQICSKCKVKRYATEYTYYTCEEMIIKNIIE